MLMKINPGEKVACSGKTDVFFPSHMNVKTINAARDICRECPLYERCVEHWLPRYEEHPEGILFGYTGHQRRLISKGRMEYVDWRKDGRLITRNQLNALEKKALAAGVPAVVNAYGLYEVEDPDERQRVIEAYDAWCREQRYPSDVLSSRSRIEKLIAVAEGKPGARLPVDLRPACPNGHDRKDMVRMGGGNANRWTCYICRAKVYASPQELVADELRRSA